MRKDLCQFYSLIFENNIFFPHKEKVENDTERMSDLEFISNENKNYPQWNVGNQLLLYSKSDSFLFS